MLVRLACNRNVLQDLHGIDALLSISREAVGWAKAHLRRAHHLVSDARMVGT
jgi:hypothetical protein